MEVWGKCIAGAVNGETIVANGEICPQRGVPQKAGIDFIVRSIRRSHIGLARQHIRIVRCQGIGSLALGDARKGHVHIAVQTTLVQGQAASGIGQRVLAFYHVLGLSRSGPGPAVIADFGGVIEVIERDEVARQVVLIRRERLAKLSQSRIAVADLQVAQDLVVGPVFLDDEDHVLDALPHSRHDRGVVGAHGVGEAVVRGHLRRQGR